jgi:HlyD family secretion protein
MKKTILFSTVILSLSLILAASMVVFFSRGKGDNELTLYGNVDVRQVDIAFRVSGKIQSLHFQEGDKVKQGELLCSLEKDPYDSLLQEAIARKEVVEADYLNAELQYKRRLEVIDSGAISGEDLDNSLARYKALKASLAEVEQSIAVAKDNLNYTQSYAPNEGIILSRIREPGSVVNPGNPVYTLSLVSPIWILAFVDEPNLGVVHYGMEATVYTDIKGGKRYKGKVGYISSMAEFTPKSVQTTALRTDLVYRIRVYIDKPDNQLIQGMPVTVKLHLDKG